MGRRGGRWRARRVFAAMPCVPARASARGRRCLGECRYDVRVRNVIPMRPTRRCPPPTYLLPIRCRTHRRAMSSPPCAPPTRHPPPRPPVHARKRSLTQPHARMHSPAASDDNLVALQKWRMAMDQVGPGMPVSNESSDVGGGGGGRRWTSPTQESDQSEGTRMRCERSPRAVTLKSPRGAESRYTMTSVHTRERPLPLRSHAVQTRRGQVLAPNHCPSLPCPALPRPALPVIDHTRNPTASHSRCWPLLGACSRVHAASRPQVPITAAT